MSIPFRFDGGEGEALAFERAEVLRCVVSRAFAPGAPIALRIGLTVEAEPEEVALSGKSTGSKRRADGRFDLVVRLISLRKAHRLALEAALRTTQG